VHFLGKLAIIKSSSWFLLGATLVCAVYLIYCLIKKPTRGIMVFCFTVASIVFAEIFLFNNVFLFHSAIHFVSAADIGWRQESTLYHDRQRLINTEKAQFLAIGSSQTHVIYTPYASTCDELAVMGMAGMGPLDFLLYKDLIAEEASEVIILTLCDFDLGRQPSLVAAKLSPPQRIDDLITLAKIVSPIASYPACEIQDFLFANGISAYRNQYLYKGVLNKLTGRAKAFPEEDVTLISDEDRQIQQLEKLRELDQIWFELNVALLDRFIEWAEREALKVCVVSGQYHPLAMQKNESLHKQADVALANLCASHPNASFIGAEQRLSFTAEDYVDGYHVGPEAGYRFTSHLISVVSSNWKIESSKGKSDL